MQELSRRSCQQETPVAVLGREQQQQRPRPLRYHRLRRASPRPFARPRRSRTLWHAVWAERSRTIPVDPPVTQIALETFRGLSPERSHWDLDLWPSVLKSTFRCPCIPNWKKQVLSLDPCCHQSIPEPEILQQKHPNPDIVSLEP